MASFVSGLIYDILPFKQQYKSVTSDTSNQYVDRKGAAAALVYDTNTITALPYDRSAYTQFIDKILDTTASKSNQEQVNRQSIMQGIKLVGIAVDEFDSGNEGIALDIYLSGLDKMIMSLPNLKERKTKLALKDKLLSLENRVGITAKHQQLSIQDIEQMDDPAQVKDHLISKFTTLSKILAPASWSTKDCEEKNRVHVANEELEGDPLSKFKRLGMLITDIVIQFAILFKQSPLPGLISFTMAYFLQLILLFDRHFGIIDRVQHVGILCIKKLLAADEKYHLHEFASEAMYTFISATLKAAVAYKETPGYTENNRQQPQQVVKPSWVWSRSSVTL